MCAIFSVEHLILVFDQLISVSSSDWLQLVSCSLPRPPPLLPVVSFSRGGGGAFPCVGEEMVGLRGDDDAGDPGQRHSSHMTLRTIAALSTV